MYIYERIRDLWTSLTSDKKKLADAILHTFAKKILGNTIADEYFKKTNDNLKQLSKNDLTKLLLYLEAVKLMSTNDVQKEFSSTSRVLPLYLSEALSSVIESEPSILSVYTEARSDIPEEQALTEASYVESYFDWIDKNVNYLKDVKSILRIVSFNELSTVWGKSAANNYLAAHYKLRLQRHCDLRRVFVYDSNYMLNVELLRQLLIEIAVQIEIGINVRVCSYEQLREKGKGYYYPLEAFGTYDRFCLAVLISHPSKSLVHFIHKEKQVRDAIEVYDNIYDTAEPAPLWQTKHKKALSTEDTLLVSLRVANIVKLSKTQQLY